MKKYSIALILTLAVIITGCNTKNTSQPIESNPQNETTTKTTYTLEEVAKHSTKDDCWMVYDGGVYNITEAIDKHPGGEAILNGCGKDATEIFNNVSKHAINAKDMLVNYKIGDLE